MEWFVFSHSILTLFTYLILDLPPMEGENAEPQLILESSEGKADIQEFNFCFDDCTLGSLPLVA